MICSSHGGICNNNENEDDNFGDNQPQIRPRTRTNSVEQMKRLYNIKDQVLGVGSFGKVLLAESAYDPTLSYVSLKSYLAPFFAVKIIAKELMASSISHFKDVYNVLKNLNVYGILKYYDLYEDHENLYLVMEYFKGNQLLDLIIAGANTPEGCM